MGRELVVQVAPVFVHIEELSQRTVELLLKGGVQGLLSAKAWKPGYETSLKRVGSSRKPMAPEVLAG